MEAVKKSIVEFMNEPVYHHPCKAHVAEWDDIKIAPTTKCQLCGKEEKHLYRKLIQEPFRCVFGIEVLSIDKHQKEFGIPRRLRFNALRIPLPCSACKAELELFVDRTRPKASHLASIPFIPCKDVHDLIREYAFHWNRDCIYCEEEQDAIFA